MIKIGITYKLCWFLLRRSHFLINQFPVDFAFSLHNFNRTLLLYKFNIHWQIVFFFQKMPMVRLLFHALGYNIPYSTYTWQGNLDACIQNMCVHMYVSSVCQTTYIPVSIDWPMFLSSNFMLCMAISQYGAICR